MRTEVALTFAKRRARSWRFPVKAIKDGDLQGGMFYWPLSLIEVVLHEAGHMVVMGHELKEFHRLRRDTWGEERVDAFDVVSNLISSHYAGNAEASDAGEIRTSWLTHRVGQKLDLWHSPNEVIESCARNLVGEWRHKPAKVFEAVPQYEPSSAQIKKVISWFKGAR